MRNAGGRLAQSNLNIKQWISNSYGSYKGWYIPSRPDEVKGESTAWYASFWRFCAGYLEERFGANWCLSPEQSLSLHAGNWTVPRQLMVRAMGGGNTVTKLPHGTSLLDLRSEPPPPPTAVKKTA
jgi:hypothetical protein